MLNNKSVMLKVLVLALSVLMLVSLAACNKNSGTTEEDMNNAIQSALAEQSAIQSSKDAALQSSIAAAQSSQDAAQSSALQSMSDAIASASKTEGTTATSATTAVVKEDITSVQAELAKLKHEYTYSPAAGLYSSSNYTDLVLLFEKASVEMMNASTKAQAQIILENTKVAAAAIPSATNAAKPVQAKIAALGDIETAVFTTSAAKVKEARKALESFMAEYEVYCDVDADDFKDTGVVVRGEKTAKVLKALGINEADLIKAEGKVGVLNAYIESALLEDMKALYLIHGKVEFDEEGDELATVVGAETAKDVIARAYYRYLILAAVNGGDVADAKLAINWEYAVDAEGNTIKAVAGDKDPLGRDYVVGKKVFDAKKPTAFFTAEQFINVYATPYLNAQLKVTADWAIGLLEDNLTGVSTAPIYSAVKALTGSHVYVKDYITDANGTKAAWNDNFLVDFDDVEDALEDIFDAFEAEVEALRYVGNYKGTKTMAQAEADIWSKFVDAMFKAGNEIINTTKTVAAEKYADYDEAVLDGLEVYYDAKGDKYVDKYNAAVANAAAYKTEFLAHAAATPNFDRSILTNKDLAKKLGYATVSSPNKYESLEKVADAIVMVTAANIKDNFTATLKNTEAGMLGAFSLELIEDLTALRDMLDPTNEEGAQLYKLNKGSRYTYRDAEAEKAGWINGEYYSNAPAFVDLTKAVDKAIAEISAIDESKYTDKEVNALIPAGATKDDKYKGKALYFANATAKEMFMDRLSGDQTVEALALDMLTKASDPTNADLVTVNKTDYPITFTYTASEQARAAAADRYVAAYNEIHAKMLSWSAVLTNSAKKVNNTSTNKGYAAVLTKAAGNAALTAEIEAVANTFVDEINKLTDAKYAVVGGMSVAYTYSDTMGATHFVDNIEKGTMKANAANYIVATGETTLAKAMDAAYKTHVDKILTKYNAIMFNKAGADTAVAADADNCNVLNLWAKKTAVANALADLLRSYKNTWTTGTKTEGGITTTVWVRTPAIEFAPQYDATSTTGPTANGKAYEAQLDALFADYATKIMAVTMNTKSAKITAANGTEILAATTIDSVDAATKVINAYVADLLGDADAGAEAAKIPGFVSTGKVVDTNSRVYKAWNVYYNNKFN